MSLEWRAQPATLAWSNPVVRWWGMLTLVSGANIAIWFVLYRQLQLPASLAARAKHIALAVSVSDRRKAVPGSEIIPFRILHLSMNGGVSADCNRRAGEPRGAPRFATRTRRREAYYFGGICRLTAFSCWFSTLCSGFVM